MQGFVYRTDDARFAGMSTERAVQVAAADPNVVSFAD
jgi:hypothetical protein